MRTVITRSLKGRRLEQVERLLQRLELRWDGGAECTVCLEEEGEVVATGSRQGNILKCIAAAPERQGEGLVSTVATALVGEALSCGQTHLFVFTKPDNGRIFRELGFFPVAETTGVALLENRRDGVRRFVEGLSRPEHSFPGSSQGPVGAIVANCNPFTLGHLHLVETAAAQCGDVHLFILSEERGAFPAGDRLEMARQGVAHLPNVLVHPTGSYLVSYVTFPDYFHKDQAASARINCDLDLAVFARCFAAPLGITRRYVGTEPACQVTAAYNARMRELLPGMGVEVVEIPRLERDGEAVSASRVRELLGQKRMAEIRSLVPGGVFAHLQRSNRDD